MREEGKGGERERERGRPLIRFRSMALAAGTSALVIAFIIFALLVFDIFHAIGTSKQYPSSPSDFPCWFFFFFFFSFFFFLCVLLSLSCSRCSGWQKNGRHKLKQSSQVRCHSFLSGSFSNYISPFLAFSVGFFLNGCRAVTADKIATRNLVGYLRVYCNKTDQLLPNLERPNDRISLEPMRW